ncbi:MAG TPA: 16S rRNA (cytosine(1402)-N(4))-methyltransferase RsmH [Tepidisphaeraceae bacterium]|nr:16S rRNA (cytosine(1402)-N(4))-methyltransferase RsmH [Tepidisphaeraceae bacterium]
MDLPKSGHESVLLDETIELLNLHPAATVVDCTLGRGGHSQAILQRLGPEGLLLALDIDPRNLEFARSQLTSAGAKVRFFHANFAEMEDVLSEAAIEKVDAILADLGISTNQLFESEYGLSFAQPMPLDMRIDPRTRTTAADLVGKLPEKQLAEVLYKNAQEHYSRRIARKIVEARRFSPITTTDRLAELVRSAIPSRGGAPAKIDPATKTFMALRMEVNQEVANLGRLLEQAPRHLKTGGRFAVISFHSTEDRVVKQAFRSAEQAGHFKVITKKPVSPSEEEMSHNPRSRSAKLRVGERTN